MQHAHHDNRNAAPKPVTPGLAAVPATVVYSRSPIRRFRVQTHDSIIEALDLASALDREDVT
jgi:hypothetical protein